MNRTYRATRGFHLGALRTTLKAGDLVEFDGRVVRHGALEREVPGFEAILDAGMLTEVDAQEPAPIVRVAPAPLVAPPPPPAPAKARGRRTLTESKPHVWESDLFGNGNLTCKVCGVTQVTNLIRVDRHGLGFHYVDAHGVAFSSMTELPCPAYIGDVAGAAAEAKMRVRDVTHRVDGVEDRVETVEERIARLEAENESLRADVAAVGRQAGDVRSMLAALVQMAEEARRNRQIGTVSLRGHEYHVPLPIIDVIDVIGEEVVVEREPVPVKARRKR